MNSQRNETSENKETEQLRIGFYSCEWGINIKSKIDVNALVDYAQSLGDEIVLSKKNGFLWTEAAQNEIMEDIKEKNLNRIVAAAWTPRTHEPIYRSTIKKTGLSPYYFQMVNIREHCSFLGLSCPKCKIGARSITQRL